MARKDKLWRRRLATTETDQIVVDAVPVEDEPESETGPLRRCVLTRQRLPKERMIRFVVGPDRQIVPDLAAKLPGRGIWLSASADVLEFEHAPEDRPPQDERAKGGRLEGGRPNKQGGDNHRHLRARIRQGR